jgi:hypothetical protein
LSTNADYSLEEAITVNLDNHPTSDFGDILEAYRGEFPAVWTYQVPSGMDMDPRADYVESRDIASEGLATQAWIDLSGPTASVSLNPNLYADTPADELAAEAERVLLNWAQDQRRRLGLPGGPKPEDNETGGPNV